VVTCKDGRPKKTSCTASVCNGSALLGDSLGVSRSVECDFLSLLSYPEFLLMITMIMTSGCGLQQRPTSPITKKYSTLKIKIDNEAVQKLRTS